MANHESISIARPMVGTWRSHVISDQQEWIKIRNDIPVLGAATMLINPCTAYRYY